jgi:hypothetical protein
MTNNHHRRAARTLCHTNHHILPHVERRFLPAIARAWARDFNIPKPVMLRAMARYARLHHNT